MLCNLILGFIVRLIMSIVNGITLYVAGLTAALLLSSNVLADDSLNEANKASFFATIDANNIASQTAILPASSKIELLSATLLNASYLDGSLGEGAQGKYDKDPLIRFDVFDCTTYVEAVLAGAMSVSENDFMPNLMKLRYKDGTVSFVTRNHFPSADWIPNNQDKLMDITALVAGDSLVMAKTVIDKPAWYQKMGKDRLACVDESSETCDALLVLLRDEGKAYAAEPVVTPYVPLKALYLDETDVNQVLLDRIPSGSIINMVRPDWEIETWIGTNMNVSHQAIAIRKGEQLFLRHASQTNEKVMDVDLLDYFSEYSEKSSLKGFNVQVLR